MNYEVRCACGRAHAVSAADAGASLPCGCGRAVEVPPLHELQAAAGQDVLSPAVRVRALLARGKLPGTRDCAGCHRETDKLIRVTVECERATVDSAGPGRGDVVGGCLLSPWVGLLLHFLRRTGPVTERGQDVVVTVPLPVCEVCRRDLRDPAALRRALRHVSEYAALLDRYPDARVGRDG